MAYKRIELTKPYFYPDDSLWRKTTPGLARESDYYPGGRYYDSQTDYAWRDPNYAYLDSIGYAPQYDARGRVIYSDGRVDDGGENPYHIWSGYSSGGSSGGYSGAYGSYLLSYQSLLDEARRKAEEAQRTRTDAAVAEIAAQQDAINQAAAQAAKQAYINREKSLNQLPQINSYLGVSGGGSESALLGLNTSYENIRNDIIRDRDNQIQENIRQQNQIKAAGDAALADIQNAYAMKNLELLQEQAALEQQYKQMLEQYQLQMDMWKQQYQLQMDLWKQQYDIQRQDKLADILSEREWQEKQMQAEQAYQMALARLKNSQSESDSELTKKQLADLYLSGYNATGDEAYLDAYNQLLGLPSEASTSGTPDISFLKLLVLDRWYATLSPEEFKKKVQDAIASNNLTRAEYEEWQKR